MTVLHELARDVGTSERTLRRALSDGAIRAQRPGPKMVDVTASEQEWVRKRWPLVSDLRASLRTQKDVRMAVLFGSMARMDSHAGSDVDVLVELRNADPLRPAALAEQLELVAGRRVQVVPLASARRLPSLLVAAVREGRVLADRDVIWPLLVEEATRLQATLDDPDELLADLDPSAVEAALR